MLCSVRIQVIIMGISDSVRMLPISSNIGETLLGASTALIALGVGCGFIVVLWLVMWRTTLRDVPFFQDLCNTLIQPVKRRGSDAKMRKRVISFN
ncbi:hypothetical protein LSM04_003212 [Trypanosoma melophagium]|uniref:uncharacterized protein n=1 Tax=Trypanosoma melophagium TaxID=715481 RepID=UPI00351A023B|nr:hypothetical protein LSM04_003212 [Trypanosoma melophagium]